MSKIVSQSVDNDLRGYGKIKTDYDSLKGSLSDATNDLISREINVLYPPSSLIGASGSAQTTTGSITSNTNIINVANAIDFKVGQGISVKLTAGVAEVVTLQVTAGATATAELKLTLGDSIYLIPVSSGDTAINVADKIRVILSDSYTISGTIGTNTVIFTAKLVGKRYPAYFSANSTGVTVNLTTTTTGANSTYFVSKITAINGNVITVADTYTGNTITGGNVYHDDTASIQAVIDYIGTNYPNGGKIIIPHGYTFRISSVRVKTKHIHITGGGVIDGEILIKSVDSVVAGTFNIISLYTKIENIKFINSKHFIGNTAIRIQYMRNAIIKGCYFENYEVGILGESLVTNFQYQQTARVMISDCVFFSTDWNVKTHWLANDSSANWVYYQHGDWHIINTQGYSDFMSDGTPTGVSHFHFEGLDGLVLTNNTTFHHQFTAGWHKKRYSLYMKETNYVVVSNNNFFEAGYEGIYIEDYRSMTIEGNSITRTGEIRPSSAIFVETIDITGTQSGSTLNIRSNNIYGTSKNGIDIGYNPINVRVDGNNMFGLGSNSTYYGSASIPAQVYSTQVLYGGTTFTSYGMVVVSNNFSDKPQNLQRGIRNNELYSSYVNAQATFGNVTTALLDMSTTGNVFNVKLNAGGESSFSFNQNFPQIFKNVVGTINSISGAGTCQIIVLVAGSTGLTITHTNTGANNVRLKGATNLVLTQYQCVTLMHTDDVWVQIA